MTFDEAQGYVVLATLACPLVAMLLLVFIPGHQKMLVRWISLVFAAAMLGLSTYIFVAYQVGADSIQMQFKLVWVENIGFLGKDGIVFHLGVDGISAPMALLTGIVAFAEIGRAHV